MSRQPLPAGDGLMNLSVLLWVSVTVGPWWLGVVIFLAAWFINYITRKV